LGALPQAGLGHRLDLNTTRLLVALVVVFTLITLVIRMGAAPLKRMHLIGGTAIGALVAAGWLLTGSPAGQTLMEQASLSFAPPAGLGTQSLTFVAPAAETLRLVTHGPAFSLLTFGIMAMLGVILGAFVWFAYKRQLRWQGFASKADFVRHSIGAVLMGVGGILAMGCSIGQGVTGVSTLALGSILVLISMIFGSWLTMKVLFYRIVFPQAGWRMQIKAILTDLKLRPAQSHPLREAPPESPHQK